MFSSDLNDYPKSIQFLALLFAIPFILGLGLARKILGKKRGLGKAKREIYYRKPGQEVPRDSFSKGGDNK